MGCPNARGKPSLADHAIGIITRVPNNALEEQLIEFRVLWRDPIDGNASEVNVCRSSSLSLYANRFVFLDRNQMPPAPYTKSDFALLEQNERTTFEAAGFWVGFTLSREFEPSQTHCEGRTRDRTLY